MIFDFYPWKIDANIEKTKKFYQGNDYSSNKEWNKMFVDILNPMQREFFDNLGIDLMKIEVRKNEFEDYVHSLHQTDLFLGDLIQKLEDFSEPVVLVAYGDHLPALTFSEEELITENHLITEYVLWSNDQRFVHYDKDLTAYQLVAYTLDRCGINEGILFRFHQEFMNDPDYLTRLAMLEYDLLYAKDQDRINQPSSASHMTMGLDDISVSSAVLYGDLLIVRGDHFTKHSVVFSNGNELSTHYIDENMLIATFPLLSAAEAGDLISVGQVSSDGTILSQTDSIPCVTSE